MRSCGLGYHVRQSTHPAKFNLALFESERVSLREETMVNQSVFLDLPRVQSKCN